MAITERFFMLIVFVCVFCLVCCGYTWLGLWGGAAVLFVACFIDVWVFMCISKPAQPRGRSGVASGSFSSASIILNLAVYIYEFRGSVFSEV